MKLALTIIYIVIALALTAVVLTQQGKDPREAASIMGTSGDSFFSKNKAKTREGMLERLTAVAATLFIVMSVVLSVFFK